MLVEQWSSVSQEKNKHFPQSTIQDIQISSHNPQTLVRVSGIEQCGTPHSKWYNNSSLDALTAAD